ncbi:MAG: glycosyltransferase family 1 protein [Ignavibacteriales bacterium]|nr:MAG: glycosyltransferase family 1 protein [Ignavibacteriales bacterium]
MQQYKKLKIAYFAGSMKPGQDGVTRVLFKLVDWLNDKDIENVFISSLIPAANEQMTKFLEVPSIAVPFYKEYKFAYPGYKKFESTLKLFKPDIIHINSPCSLGLAAIKYAERNGIPVVATYHTHFPSYAKYYNIKQLEFISWNYLRKLYNRCDRVLVPSITIMNELQEQGFKTTEYLPHGIDLNLFNNTYKSNEWKKSLNIKDKKVLLFVGRLVWEKDLRTLIEIYDLLTVLRDDMSFVLVGDGPIRKELEKNMPKAHFLGYKTGEELSTIYASSDLFVFPSTTETFGNVVLEAMASGTVPVCANRGGASSSIKNNHNGIICDAKNAIDFSKKILALINNQTELQRISENCIEYASKQSWDNIFSMQYQLYLDVIKHYSFKSIGWNSHKAINYLNNPIN